MSMALLLLYLAITYLQPVFFYSWLEPYRISLVFALLGLAAAIFSGITNRVSLKVPQLILLVALTGVVGMSSAVDGWLGGIIVSIQQFFTSVALFYLILPTVLSIRRLALLTTVFALTVIVLCCQGIAATHYGFYADLLIDQENVGDAEGGTQQTIGRVRSVGSLSDPNDFAQVLVVVTPFLFLPATRGRKLRFVTVTLPSAAVVIYTIYLTHSRGAVLGLAGVAIAGLFSSNFGMIRSTIAAIFLFGIGSAAKLTGGRSFEADDSVEGRFNAWSTGLQLLKSNPIFGVSFGAFTEYNELTAHNSLVLCFAELGLTGCFLWLGLIVVSMLQLNSLARLPPEDELSEQIARWARFVRTALIGFLITAFSLSRTYASTLYLLFGMTVALTQIASRAGKWKFTRTTFSWMALTGVIELGSIPFIYLFLRVRGAF